MKHSSEEYDNFMASLPADPRERMKVFSAVARGAMKQATADFTTRIAPLGFKRKRDTLLWTRKRALTVDSVSVKRNSIPINASVRLQMSFSIAVVNGPLSMVAVGWGDSNMLRTPAGKLYHTRFNAVTGDSYDKVMDNLVACLVDHGEPGFAAYRDEALLNHPEIRPEAARLLQATIKDS